MKTVRKFILVAILVSLALGQAIAKESPSPLKWEKDIATFEQRDKTNKPAADPILFVGSSNMRLWDVAKAFPEYHTINRAFGGSQVNDSVYYFDRIVTPYKPHLIVMYAGSNDISYGRTPEEVLSDFKKFVAKTHAALPETKIAYISITTSPSRWNQVDRVKKTNRLISNYIKTDSKLVFIDLFPKLLGADGKPLPDIFIHDNLHMNQKGQSIWAKTVRPYLN